MLLSVDWDAYSGTRELVFDAPIWGIPDRDWDRVGTWEARAARRRKEAPDWAALAQDFPLYGGWQALEQYAGCPAFVTLSHADIWPLLERWPGQPVLNIDSHHDLGSLSGDRARLRPGNWAGLALQQRLAARYECRYPLWHADLPVAEGYDLDRTRSELAALVPAPVLERVILSRTGLGQAEPELPPPPEVTALVLVQSPAWTNPAHDREFWKLSQALGAEVLQRPLRRN